MFVALATAWSIAAAELPGRQDSRIGGEPNHELKSAAFWKTNSLAAMARLVRLIEIDESTGFAILLKNFDGYFVDTHYVPLMGNSHEQ